VLDPQFPLTPLEPPWLAALEDILPAVEVLLCDEHEAQSITAVTALDKAAAILLARGPRTVVIKQGGQGATVYQEGYRHHQEAVRLGEVVDTIGAGDAFDAGVTLGLLEGWSWERSALFAAVAAGLTVTGVGGSATMPDAAQVEEIIRGRGVDTPRG
jgi:2-dehydro-3-deoxygluconokinase